MFGGKSGATPELSPLFVVGVGLVSPAGFSAADHVFFVRAGTVQPVPSPFVNEDDEPLPCAYCPWLSATATLAERVEQLAFGAASEALDLVRGEARNIHLSVVLPSPSAEFSEPAQSTLASHLRQYLAVTTVSRFRGATGAHEALLDARKKLEAGTAEAVCVVGADSAFSVPCVEAAYRRRRVVWLPLEPPPSEAAGAVVLMARRSPTLKPLARFIDAGTTPGASNDFNDEPVDGTALTYLFKKLPNRGGVPMVFGPLRSERLRQRDWHLAAARARRHFGAPYANVDVETAIGQVGAAAGSVHLAYAVACNHYQSVDPAIPPGSPFYAWAISADGVRGLAVLEGSVS